MTRLPALWLAGCVACAGLILSNDTPSFEPRLPPAKTEAAAPATLSSDGDANSPLRDVRLTGVVIAPDLRIAIFAVSGTDSLALSEGETLKGWRIDRILPGKVWLSGPASTVSLEPKPDANLVRPLAPVAVRSDQLEPRVPPSAEPAGAPEQPTDMAPTPVGNLSAAIPVQPPVYPYYFPQNDAGYGQNFRFGFFHRHDFHHGDFRNSAIPFRGAALPFDSAAVPFHGAALHAGEFHGGGHR